ncbi:Disease resistance protein L6 [Linum perenne]
MTNFRFPMQKKMEPCYLPLLIRAIGFERDGSAAHLSFFWPLAALFLAKIHGFPLHPRSTLPCLWSMRFFSALEDLMSVQLLLMFSISSWITPRSGLFLMMKSFVRGEIIAPFLAKAIKESKVYIPIISQGYASSKWCLQELALMVKWCKQGDDRIILPIFYMMEPRDVRNQEGSYKKAFRLHCKKYDVETIKEWKEALKEGGALFLKN